MYQPKNRTEMMAVIMSRDLCITYFLAKVYADEGLSTWSMSDKRCEEVPPEQRLAVPAASCGMRQLFAILTNVLCTNDAFVRQVFSLFYDWNPKEIQIARFLAAKFTLTAACSDDDSVSFSEVSSRTSARTAGTLA